VNPGATGVGKRVRGLHRDTPSVVAARRVLKRRLSALPDLLRLAAATSERDLEAVHQLRVLTRRATAALQLFRGCVDQKTARQIRRQLRRIRRAASDARIDDVHAQTFAADAARLDARLRPALEYALRHVAVSRDAAQKELCEVAAARQLARFDRRRRRLNRSIRRAARRRSLAASSIDPVLGNRPPYNLRELSARALPPLLHDVATVCGGDLNNLGDVHRLRIAGKRLRYVAELLSCCFPAAFRDDLLPRLEDLQQRLGEINDDADIVARLESLTADGVRRLKDARRRARGDAPPAVLEELLDHYRASRDARHRSLLEWWGSPMQREMLDGMAAMLAGPARIVRLPAPPRGGNGRSHAPAMLLHSPTHSGAGPRNGSDSRSASDSGQSSEPRPPSDSRPALESRPASESRPEGSGTVPPADAPSAAHTRVAAIDVGTNSIRLVVAELDPLTRFRVIEDVKETTRLGSGLYGTGTLQPVPVERSLRALQRMKQVAERYHVTRLRAVGTSALREASNSGDFLELVRQEAGLSIEVIDAEHEARLALSSVSHAFDLNDRRAAIVDIGGGSTEMVLTSGGVIDGLYKFPLGGVRLTELYGDPDSRGGYRFGEMRRAVARIIEETIRDAAFRPEFIIGAGGTFTNLARLSIRRGGAADGVGRFPFAIRGYELTRDEVAYLLDWLRRMSLEERRRVPGLSAQRSEIIVAGVCIVDQLMEHLGVSRLRTHDGGIRDGLLAEMIDDLGLRAQLPRGCAGEAIEAVRRFAERMNYERPHSEHVARLALRIFDQLAEQAPDAAGAWARPVCREYLHAAAVLHDVGMLIEWYRHHRHSYDMIVHADLDCFARREIEIIAGVARYHRGPGPRPQQADFRKLGDDDQRVVAHLAGILRVADGLDRLHTQNVRDVIVRADGRHVRFDVVAADDAVINLRFARRKADVFVSAFHTDVQFVWTPAARSSTLVNA